MPEKTEALQLAREIITVLHDKVDAGICELDPALIAEVLGPRLAPSKTTRDIVGALRDRLRTLFASWTDPESENRVPPMELLAGIETQLGFLEAQIEAVLRAGGGERREG